VLHGLRTSNIFAGEHRQDMEQAAKVIVEPAKVREERS